MYIEEIAKVCHEANKAYCEAFGDYSQLHWEDAPAWQKESAVNGVVFAIDNSLSGPVDSHVNWMKEKLENGWKYGPIKDADAKTHPCLVEYGELPIFQRMKDSLFIGIVRTLTYQKE